MTAAQIAQALQLAIIGTPPAVTTLPSTVYTREANDTINTSEISGISGVSASITGTGIIGDNASLSDTTQDVDMIRIQADRGSLVTVNVRAAILGSTLDSFLRVFDAEGLPLSINGLLVQNDNTPGSTDSQLSFTAPNTGIYYIGISSSGNSTYNAAVLGNSTAGVSTGITRWTSLFSET